MAFIDDLAYLLFAISFSGLLLLYAVVSSYFSFRKGAKAFTEHLQGASIPMLVIGTYMTLMGIWGQMTWPLPGSYNILFFDPLLSFGMLILAFAISMRLKVRLEFAGFLGLLIGVLAIIYGIQGYGIGLTSAPMALLALYFFYGLAGIFTYPVALIADRKPGLKRGYWKGWDVMLALFILFLFLASITSGYIGANAIVSHLITAP